MKDHTAPQLISGSRLDLGDARTTILIALHAIAIVLFLIQPKAAMALVALVAVTVLAFKRPVWLIVVAIGFIWVNDIIADFDPMSKFTAWKDVILLITLAIVAAQAAWRRESIIPRHALAIPLLVVIAHFIVMCSLSGSLVQVVLGLKNSIFYMSWFFLTPSIIRTRKDVNSLIGAILFAATAIAIYNLWRVQQPWGTFPPRRDGTMLDGATQAHWAGAPYILPFGILFGSALIPIAHSWRKWLVYAIVLVCLASLVASGARAQVGGVILILATMGYLSGRLTSVMKIIALGVVAAVIVQTTMSVKVSDRAESAFNDQDVSRQAREDETADLMIPFVLTHPFGAGTGSMTASKSGAVWASHINSALQGGMIHNNFLYVAIEIGWIGMLAWAWMLVVAVKSIYETFREASDPFIRCASLGVLGMILQYSFLHFFAGVLTSQLISYAIWPVFGLVVVLSRLNADTARPEAEALPALAVGVGAEA